MCSHLCRLQLMGDYLSLSGSCESVCPESMCSMGSLLASLGKASV